MCTITLKRLTRISYLLFDNFKRFLGNKGGTVDKACCQSVLPFDGSRVSRRADSGEGGTISCNTGGISKEVAMKMTSFLNISQLSVKSIEFDIIMKLVFVFYEDYI